MNNHTAIEQTILSIIDPTLNQPLQELGIQCQVILESNCQCTLTLTAGFPTQDWGPAIHALILSTVQSQFPTLKLTLHFKTFIRAHRTQMPGKGLRGIKNTIAIASGKGGVGKSTVTVNLAIALAQAGARVGILDADIYGPSIPMMLGDCQPVTAKDNHYLPAKAHGIQAMSIGYLTKTDEQALIWRGPMLAKSLLQMIDLTLWDDLDYLFIDLPPGTGDIQLSLVQKIPLTAAIVVTTPQNIATLDAQKAIQLFARTHIDVLGLLENMALHTCKACGHQEAIFGQDGAQRLCEQFNIPLLGQLPLDGRVREKADQGQPISALHEDIQCKPWIQAAMKVAQKLATRPINYADKFPPIVHSK